MKYNALKLKQIFPSFQIQIKQKAIAQERENQMKYKDLTMKEGQVKSI